MLRRYSCVQFLWVLCLALSGIYVQADEVKLVTGDNYPPFVGRALPNGGLFTEIVERVFQEMGHETKLTYAPWRRAELLTQQHLAIGTFPYVKDAARMELYAFSDAIYVAVERFFVRKQSDIEYNHPSDLAGMTLCRPHGYSMESLQHLIDAELVQLWKTPDLESCFRMLDAGRLELVPIDATVGRAMSREMFGDAEHFATLDKPVRVNGLYFMMSKSYPNGREIMTRFNQELSKLREDGTLARIYRSQQMELPEQSLVEAAQ